MLLDKTLIAKLIVFRRQLHSEPEVSGNEINTSRKIVDFIESTNPSKVIMGIGGHGFAVVFDSGNAGPTVMLRADLDALPIQESNKFAHRSLVKGVAHLCGHDGHSTILAGVAFMLKQNQPKKGRVVLLFQPAEETGEGAAAVIADKKFADIKPDYTFALHNLPGFERGTVCVKDKTFASASVGIIARIKGLSSHAAHPEDGRNPDKALAQMILALNYIVKYPDDFNDFTLLTIIHAKLGEVAFGTTPGSATLMATLRTYLDSDMRKLRSEVESTIRNICKEHKLKVEIEYTEEFPATSNNKECVDIVLNASKKLNIPIEILKEPFRWSEDFGHFSKISKSTIFGIGSGKKHPQLHNENYDFPDEIINNSVKLYLQIVDSILTLETSI
jgi:amidohydrolase